MADTNENKIRVAVIEDGLRHQEVRRNISKEVLGIPNFYLDVVASLCALHEIRGYGLILVNPIILPIHKLGLSLENLVRTSPETQQIAIIEHRPLQTKEKTVLGKTIPIVAYKDTARYVKDYVDRKLAEANADTKEK
jgi:hypothetical protein